jgi:capsular polysaccharide biosynthesis protein
MMFNKIKKTVKNLLIPKNNGISVSDVPLMEEELIFPKETFNLPENLDVCGERHHHFSGYTCDLPPFYVRSIKDGKCVVGKEEISTSDNRVIVEYTTQKVNQMNVANLKLRNPHRINGSVATLSLSGLENNYYHWLTECLARYYLLEKSRFKPDFYILSNTLPFQEQYIKLLGIDRDKILKINPNTLIQANEIIVPSLINNWEYVDFRGYNHYQKQWLPNWIGNLYTENKKSEIVTGTRLYISRSFANYRKLENEDEVIKLLKKYGFKVYHLENMSVEEQVELFSNASVILGAHGAGFSNIYFCNQDVIICELFSEHYHESSFRILANVLGLKYNYIIGKTKKIKNIHPKQENMFIDVEKVEAFLETL